MWTFLCLYVVISSRCLLYCGGLHEPLLSRLLETRTRGHSLRQVRTAHVHAFVHASIHDWMAAAVLGVSVYLGIGRRGLHGEFSAKSAERWYDVGEQSDGSRNSCQSIEENTYSPLLPLADLEGTACQPQ